MLEHKDREKLLRLARAKLKLPSQSPLAEIAKMAGMKLGKRVSRGMEWDALVELCGYVPKKKPNKSYDESSYTPSWTPVSQRERNQVEKCADEILAESCAEIEEPKREWVPKRSRDFCVSPEFLSSLEWRRVRMKVLVKRGSRCECCGAKPSDGVRIHVDHVKPRKTHPHLALDESNLQILCEECNHGKGNVFDTDFRPRLVKC